VAKPNAVPATFAGYQLPRSDHHLVTDRTPLLLLISGMAARETIHAKYMHYIIYQAAVLVIVFFTMSHPMFY